MFRHQLKTYEVQTRGMILVEFDSLWRCEERCVWDGVEYQRGQKMPRMAGSEIPHHCSWHETSPPPKPEGNIEDAIINARSWQDLKALAKEHLDLEPEEVEGQFDEAREKVLSEYRKATQ